MVWWAEHSHNWLSRRAVLPLRRAILPLRRAVLPYGAPFYRYDAWLCQILPSSLKMMQKPKYSESDKTAHHFAELLQQPISNNFI